MSRAIAWRRPNQDQEDLRTTVPYSWSGWGSIYMKRWQYWPVWGVSKWWKFSITDACDGKRASKLIVLPFLGAFVYFFKNRLCGCDCLCDCGADLEL